MRNYDLHIQATYLLSRTRCGVTDAPPIRRRARAQSVPDLNGILSLKSAERWHTTDMPQVILERSVARSGKSFTDTRAQYFITAADVAI